MNDGQAAASGWDQMIPLVQQILSGLPGGCSWLLPVADASGRIVDFRVAATSDAGQDIYGRGITRRHTRLSQLYPSMVGGSLWQLYQTVLASGVPGRIAEFHYRERTAGVVAESLFDVAVSPVLGGLLVWWQRIDQDQHRSARIELLGRLGSAEYDLATGASIWSPGMYQIFERDPALGPMSQAEQGAALLAEDRGISETAWQTLDSGAPSDVTVRFRLGQSIKHLRILSDIARDAGGAPLAIHAVVQDITSRIDSGTEVDRLRDQLQTREITALAEHRLASQVQNMIQPLPQDPLRLADLEIVLRYLPAESALQVGGDWYHTHVLPDGRVILAIGDVAGHGLDAASGMAHLRYGLIAWLSGGVTDPPSLAGYLNRLCLQLKITCTAIIAEYDPANQRLRWSRAGHPPPLRARAGTTKPLSAPTGILLGAIEDSSFPAAECHLRIDDLLLFYTDGLVERRSHPGLFDHVRQAMSAASELTDDNCLGDLVAKLERPNPYDDTCIMAIRVRA